MGKRKHLVFKLVMVLMVVAISAKGIQLYLYNANLNSKIEVLKQQIQQQQKEQKQLTQQQKDMNTDAFIENYARKVLGLVKKGELLFIDKGRTEEKSN